MNQISKALDAVAGSFETWTDEAHYVATRIYYNRYSREDGIGILMSMYAPIDRETAEEIIDQVYPKVKE